MVDLLAVLRHAVRARLLDERLTQLGRAGRIGFHPDGRGMETTIAAAVLAMQDGDHVFPSARDHAAFLARGMPVARYVASALGTADDRMLGHAAPAHLSARDLRIGSPSGLVSNHLTHAAGLAWAAKLRGDALFVLAIFGDAAANAGDFHSAVNFAGATKAPVIFLCRSDRTAPSLPSPTETVAEKAIAYGIASATCSADDPESVAGAIERARASGAPALIEAIRSDARDPLDALRAKLVAAGAWDPTRDLELRRELMGEIESAIAAAEASGPPPRESIFREVYSELPRHLRDQEDSSRRAGAER